jgi:hypothetical protein
LSSDRDLSEALGRDFALLAFDVDDAAVAGFATAARVLGVPLKIVRDSYAGGREAYGARLILVRPDQYVVWTGDAAPDDSSRILGIAVGPRG